MKIRLIIIAAMLAGSFQAFAQNAPKTPAEEEKLMRENIDKEISKWEDGLKLEDWQVFYLDSILTHDYYAMKKELSDMSRMKVESSDLYLAVQDKWMEKIYCALKKVFDDQQWAKFNKMGAGKQKNERDKRAAKRNGN